MRGKKSLAVAWAAVVLLGAGAAKAETVYGGIDSWVTRGDGSSSTDFSREPIPAGFFCRGSQAFTGKIVWRGVPVATDDPRVAVDTIIQRLDDATFNRLGQATTRIKVRALNLESVAPLQTECGSFQVRTSLVGEQPMTRMQIFREGENGGRYLAPLALDVRLTFTSADRRAGRTLELLRRIRLGADARATWALDENKSARPSRTLLVDSDGDGIPETQVPRSSNFAAGRRAGQDKLVRDCSSPTISCHEGDGCEHCVESCQVCGGTSWQPYYEPICP